MGLLKHPKNNRYNNRNLDNPARINIKNKLTPDDIHVNKDQESNKSSRHINKPRRVTTAVNIRVDNHIRNEISALIQIGFAKNNKALVSQLVQDKVSTLDPEQSKRFDYLRDILEKKDTLNYIVKYHK